MAEVVIAAKLPNLGSLRGAVGNMLLVRYIMDCARVEPNYYLPLPPPSLHDDDFVMPGSTAEKKKIEALVELMCDTYSAVMLMLAEECATDAERRRAAEHSAFVHLQNFLPKFTWKDIVKMPKPKMTHKDWVFMFKHCNGKNSSDDKEILFVGEENMKKFQEYLLSPEAGQL